MEGPSPLRPNPDTGEVDISQEIRDMKKKIDIYNKDTNYGRCPKCGSPNRVIILCRRGIRPFRKWVPYHRCCVCSYEEIGR